MAVIARGGVKARQSYGEEMYREVDFDFCKAGDFRGSEPLLMLEGCRCLASMMRALKDAAWLIPDSMT